MSYGADGQRRKKSVTPSGGPTSDTVFVYDGPSLVQERNGSGLILANYTWGLDDWNINAGQGWVAGNIGDKVLLQRRASTPGDLAGGSTSFYGSDPSSNTRLLIDSSGNVTDRMTYEAFGQLFGRTGTTITPLLFGGPVGYYQDSARRLNVGWRVYDPAVGRWTSMDPIGFYGGLWNLFGYVGNNPVNAADPIGWSGSTHQEQCRVCRDICKSGRSPALAEECDRCSRFCRKGIGPRYNPDAWNDFYNDYPDGQQIGPNGIQGSNNCTSYAFNRPYGHGANALPHPSEGIPNGKRGRNCKELLDNATQGRYRAIPKEDLSGDCPLGYYKVRLYVNPNDERIYHWYRQDEDGNWSHKPGHTPVTNLDFSGRPIRDPNDADRGQYT